MILIQEGNLVVEMDFPIIAASQLPLLLMRISKLVVLAQIAKQMDKVENYMYMSQA
jgi:hypothetical protein